MDDKKRCPVSNKLLFTKTKAKRIVNERDNIKQAYHCKHCGKYHLSSKTKQEMRLNSKLKYTNMRKNIANFEISRPDQKLIIMRGLPGSGKSTEAKKLKGESGVIHSTDEVIEAHGDYHEHFRKMVELEDWSAHGKMHSINLHNSIRDIKAGISPVIVDNTNIRIKEARKYIEAGLEAGLDDANIKIVDIGDGGKTLEELVARNAHGVPFDVLESMHKTYLASGELTVKRIIETAGEKKKKILYSAVVLDEKSREKLLKTVGHHIPEGWEVIAHHITVIFGSGFPEHLATFVDASCDMKVVAIGKSDMAIAVKVEGIPTANAIPHITIAINRAEGGKPVMSNQITNWIDLENHIYLSGIAKEITA